MQTPVKEVRLGIIVSGTVQGVGFRPFVHSLAKSHRLTGFVRNSDGAVEIEVQGSASSIAPFLQDLRQLAPPLSEIHSIETSELEAKPETEFSIVASNIEAATSRFVTPDSGTCNQCLTELFDKGNRRYRYPFINCTNCGPRFTIIESLPYDRSCTTMRKFKMCSLCQEEYDDPSSRRFHAQPNACDRCGPSLTLVSGTAMYTKEDALRRAIALLAAGKIVATKGLGGFHLLCSAENIQAIRELRRRKRRTSKPFALMMVNLEMIRAYCRLTGSEETALTASSRPIVLLKRNAQCSLPADIAPGTDVLGVMLPYTPLHHLIASDFNKPFIATSGNFRDEPIAIDNEEAHQDLAELADAWLQHDREIRTRFDDSIVHLIGEQQFLLRRARGLAPQPLKLPFKTNLNALGVGGHLKNTFCLVRNDLAYMSQHIGDLESIEAVQHFEHTLSSYITMFNAEPQIIAHDLHADYQSTQIAKTLAAQKNVPLFQVQHHHAHLAACLVEHGLMGKTIGVVFDGLGEGSDGTLWGGEFMMADLRDFQRLAHFKPVKMPGGAQAIRQPWRMVIGYALSENVAEPSGFASFVSKLESLYGKSKVNQIRRQLLTGLNSPSTSSSGRLFDACSALLGICLESDYEAQAAIELEVKANQHFQTKSLEDFQDFYPFAISDVVPYVIETRAVLESAYQDVCAGLSVAAIAAKFHRTVAQIVLSVLRRIRESSSLNDVCLTGGVFQNRLLLQMCCLLLTRDGFKVHFPQKLPANDGGLSLGQAVVALAKYDAIIGFKD